MNGSRESILVVDDERLIRMTLRENLTREGYHVLEAETGRAALERLNSETVDLMLLDYRLPDINGLEVLRQTRVQHPEVSIILLTAYSSLDGAVEAIKLGAYDYLRKPINFDELEAAIAKALETTRLRRELVRLRDEQSRSYGITNIIGRSKPMRKIFELIRKVASSGASTVMIQGESGTGKDLVAKAIHYASKRTDQPFMNITCSALPETLLESELFGHERGAFTDAKTQKKGLFDLAAGGTIFLDEIGDMGLALQAKLLRFLEEKAFKRVGGTEDIRVDVRVIGATNRDLETAVAEGAFRADLYYRLKVIPIQLPPLRERKEDIPDLVSHFLDQFNRELKRNTKRLTPEALECVLRYDWPGNVRELRNVIERTMILENKEELGLIDLPAELLNGDAGQCPNLGAENSLARQFALPENGVALREVECCLVRQALDLTDGNQTRAARLLGIRRDSLRYRMKKFGLG